MQNETRKRGIEALLDPIEEMETYHGPPMLRRYNATVGTKALENYGVDVDRQVNSSKQAKRIQGTRWCWTLNNPEKYAYDPLKWNGIRYVCYQLELGQNGTQHWQGK